MDVIADSSGLISLLFFTDINNKLALKISVEYFKKNKVTIPGEIITESVNFIGRRDGHEKALKIIKKLMNSESYAIAETTGIIRQRALEKFKLQKENVSFTDCLVMAFADEYKTKQIFGFDKAFAKNGYIRIGIDKS